MYTHAHAHAHTHTHTVTPNYLPHAPSGITHALLLCELSSTHTITGPSPVLTMQFKGQQITDCTFMMGVCVCSCGNVSVRAQADPGDVLETGQSSLTQLKAVYRKMSVKEYQLAEKQALGLVNISHRTE